MKIATIDKNNYLIGPGKILGPDYSYKTVSFIPYNYKTIQYVYKDGNFLYAGERTKTNQELAQENKRLQQEINALTITNTFLEDCIIEIAQIIYAEDQNE